MCHIKKQRQIENNLFSFSFKQWQIWDNLGSQVQIYSLTCIQAIIYSHSLKQLVLTKETEVFMTTIVLEVPLSQDS